MQLAYDSCTFAYRTLKWAIVEDVGEESEKRDQTDGIAKNKAFSSLPLSKAQRTKELSALDKVTT